MLICVSSKKLPTNSSPEDFGRSAEVNWAMRWFSVHSFTKETVILHFLANESAR